MYKFDILKINCAFLFNTKKINESKLLKEDRRMYIYFENESNITNKHL